MRTLLTGCAFFCLALITFMTSAVHAEDCNTVAECQKVQEQAEKNSQQAKAKLEQLRQAQIEASPIYLADMQTLFNRGAGTLKHNDRFPHNLEAAIKIKKALCSGDVVDRIQFTHPRTKANIVVNNETGNPSLRKRRNTASWYGEFEDEVWVQLDVYDCSVSALPLLRLRVISAEHKYIAYAQDLEGKSYRYAEPKEVSREMF